MNIISADSGCLKFRIGSTTYALCYGKKNIGNINATGNVGYWYYYVCANLNISFGVTYASQPFVTGSVSSNNLSYLELSDGNITTTGIDSIGVGSPQAQIANVKFSWMAIGALA